MRGWVVWIAVLLPLFPISIAMAEGGNTNVKLAPGYGDLKFKPPVPGSYQLPKLGMASDGKVLDSNARPQTLHGLMGENAKVVVLSFIYSTCSDVNGCPLATAVLHKLKSRLQKDPQLARQVRLLTLSFNPEHDTPQRMKAFGEPLQQDGIEWLFLTTRNEQELQPILQGYRQLVEKVYDEKNHFTNTYNHNLRVYLIDKQKQIRNIYNVDLLHPDTLIGDIKTLVEEKPVLTSSSVLPNPNVYRAGDNKQEYDNRAYQTHSISLNQRQGQTIDLLRLVNNPPLGLPPAPVPQDNQVTAEKIQLGRKLFYDRRLSYNNTFSCAMCHIPEQGFTSNEMATAVGVEGRTVRRNSPTLYNVGYAQTLFHDGRENRLEYQVWGPLLAHNEMANPSVGAVVEKINHNKDYDGLFEKAFGRPAGIETIGMAIASYERALISANSPFDRWYFGKQEQAMPPQAQRGFKLFVGKAECSQCHIISKDYAFFSDNGFHNTGIGYQGSMLNKSQKQTRPVQIAPGVFADVPNAIIQSLSESKANDLGHYEISQNPKDRWSYKTPSLRNVALTQPYMHDGSLASLEDVVAFYNQGGIVNENLDSLLKPLHLSPQESEALVAFLQSLTGDNVESLVSDAFAAPIGDKE